MTVYNCAYLFLEDAVKCLGSVLWIVVIIIIIIIISLKLLVGLCHFFRSLILDTDRLCGLVVRVPGYRSRGPGSIPYATRFSEK
jgi:hypothetical protein